jgi:hypothetical protein
VAAASAAEANDLARPANVTVACMTGGTSGAVVAAFAAGGTGIAVVIIAIVVPIVAICWVLDDPDRPQRLALLLNTWRHGTPTSPRRSPASTPRRTIGEPPTRQLTVAARPVSGASGDRARRRGPLTSVRSRPARRGRRQPPAVRRPRLGGAKILRRVSEIDWAAVALARAIVEPENFRRSHLQ